MIKGLAVSIVRAASVAVGFLFGEPTSGDAVAGGTPAAAPLTTAGFYETDEYGDEFKRPILNDDRAVIERAVPVQPGRRELDGGRAVPGAPDVDWAPMTVTLRGLVLSPPGPYRPVVARLTRKGDRVHVEYVGAGQEWLFRRNPVSSKHFSGELVNKQTRQILYFSFSELRMAGFATSWESTGLMGFDPSEVAALRRTGESRTAFGIRFHRYVCRDPAPSTNLEEVWWSAEHQLPLRLLWRRGTRAWSQEITGIERRVDEKRLRDPEERYPEYTWNDIVDAREARCCGAAALSPQMRAIVERLQRSRERASGEDKR
jgi:hypothetical protein